MKFFYLMLFSILLCISTANAQCTWYTKISTFATGEYSLAIKSDSSLWSWGKNDSRQLGNGSTTNSSTPISISAGSKWISISAGGWVSMAIKSDSTLWAWGYNGYQQYGNGPTGGSGTPTQIGVGSKWISVAIGYAHTLAVKSDGTLWATGLNQWGQVGLGVGTGTFIASFTQVGTATNWVSVFAGYGESLGIKSDGTLWGWGYNGAYLLGDGTNVDKWSPVQIGTATDWVSVSIGLSHCLGVKTNGTLWGWGNNAYGVLGDGSSGSTTAPKLLSSEAWMSVVAGYYQSLGVKADGTLWAWGVNSKGQLGNGTSGGSQYTPIKIGSSTEWQQVTVGMESSVALKINGLAYGMGLNDAGQLGDGTLTNRNSPTQIGAAPNFTLPTANSSITKTQNSFTWYNNDCILIASVMKQGGTTAISGNTTAKVWIENNQAAAFGKRHYEILPAANATTATGRVTLYFTQQEFTDFNAVNDVKLPVDAADAANYKANLKIEKMTGASSDGTGLPVSYNGSSTTIDPTDANIVWNSANSYWEVTISTTGFGAFFVKTQPENLVIPLDKTGLTRATPAAAAYSLRLLSTTYPGAAIKVRRDNDNATQDIGFATDGYLDVASLKSFVGANNGYVTRWYDQSGSGNDAKQNDNTKQPIIVRAGVVERVNKMPAIYFGTSSLATEKLVIFTKAASMVGVAKGNNATPATFVSKTGTAAGNNLNYPGPFDYTNTSGEFTVGNAATTTYNLIQAANSTPKSIVNNQVNISIYSFVIPSSGTYQNYVGGIQAGSQTVNGFQDGGNSLMLGNRNDGGGSANFWTSEIVLFNLALTPTERQTMEGAQVVLPLEWLSVKGQLTNNNTARITWQVDEQYVKNYEIEKSTDGVGYSTIGQFASTGNGVHIYSFTEEQQLSGTAYYRIKQTDLDGRFTHSTVITLNSNQVESTITVYPNPVQDVVTVTTGVSLLNTVATLYNANGIAIQSFTVRSSSFTINLGAYPAGIYILKTANGKATRIIRK